MENQSRQPATGKAEATVPAIWQVGDIILDHYEGYCQLNATLGLFSLGSGEEGSFLEFFFAKNHQKTAKKSAQWGKLIKGKL